jgi:hypothetical protein
MDQPVPFTIVRRPGEPEIATNGTLALVVDGGQVRLRRGIRTAAAAPQAERLLPHLNALAGELLANSAMAAHEIAARLDALRVACVPPVQENIEWAYGEIDGVRVYTDGKTVMMTRQDLQVG